MPQSTTHTDGQVFTAAHYNNLRTDMLTAGAGYINVKDPAYGAVGNGVADDSVALQAAFTAAALTPFSTVIIPPGTYTYATTLTIANNVQVMGLGRRASILKYTGATIGIDISAGPLVGGSGISLMGFQLTGAAGTIGLRLGSIADLLLDNIEINGNSATATGWSNTAIQCNVPTTATAVVNFRIVDCDIHEILGKGLTVVGANSAAQHVYIAGSNIRACHQGGVYSPQAVNGWTIIGSNFEAAEVTSAINLVLGAAIIIHGNFFEQVDGSATAIDISSAGADTGGISIVGNVFQQDAVSGTRLAINIAGSTYVHGLVIQGNTFNGAWQNCISAIVAKGAIIGPNFLGAGAVTHVSSVYTGSQGVYVIPDGSPVQVIAMVTPLVINCALGEYVVFGAYNGIFTIGAPINMTTGSRLHFRFIHDATANVYAITWNAVFKRAAGAFANTNTSGAVDDIAFWFDGTNWYEIGRALNVS